MPHRLAARLHAARRGDWAARIRPSAQQEATGSYFPRAFDADVILYPALTAEQRAQLVQDLRRTIELNQESIRVYEEYQRREGVSREAEIARARATILDASRRIAALVAERKQHALSIARAGKVTDLPQLRTDVSTILAAARTNQLMGNAEGTAHQAAAIEVARVFSENFARTCGSQSFDHIDALGLQRQNELLGSGIDVTHCAYRLLEASINATTESIRWRHCGLGYGDWKMRATGLNAGKGSRETGPATARRTFGATERMLLASVMTAAMRPPALSLLFQHSKRTERQ